MNKLSAQETLLETDCRLEIPLEEMASPPLSLSQPAVTSHSRPGSEAINDFPHLANLNNYVVVLSSGAEDAGKRATLAFSAACTAQAMNLDTQLFLVGDGTFWAYQGSYDDINLKGFPALSSLVESFVELDGKIFVCSACDTVCALPEDNQGQPLLRQPFIKPRGLASILEHMVGGSSITF